MADRTIDDFPELSPSLNERLKSGALSAEDIYLPARVNNRTIKVKMDGPLFSPTIPAVDDAPDPQYNGAQLAVRQGERRWTPPMVVYSADDGIGSRSDDDNQIDLSFDNGDPNKTNPDLRDFSDICFIYRDSWGWDVSPWYSLFFLMNRLRNLNGDVVNISSNRRTQGGRIEYTGDNTALRNPAKNVKVVIVR